MRSDLRCTMKWAQSNKYNARNWDGFPNKLRLLLARQERNRWIAKQKWQRRQRGQN